MAKRPGQVSVNVFFTEKAKKMMERAVKKSALHSTNSSFIRAAVLEKIDRDANKR